MARTLPRVFISYRREDSAAHAGRLADALEAAIGTGSVFMDVESIVPGADFTTEIERAIGAADVVVIVIGPAWTSVEGPDGTPRLQDDRDFVRSEIDVAMRSSKRMIPVLVGDASMPSQADLPESISRLSHINAFELSDRRWRDAVEGLVELIVDQARRCPSCAAENGQHAAFCFRCGTALTEAEPVRERRKFVTVLATETSAKEHLDPEDERAVLTPLRERVRAEVERFGGTMTANIGDALVAIFGAERSHEDDAERAVRAALRIVDAEYQSGADGVHIRAAVDSGEALVTENPAASRTLVSGEIVNRTLRSLIVSTERLVIGGATREAIGDTFVFAEAAHSSVSETISVRSRVGTNLTTRDATPLVGREVDFALLHASLDKTVSSAITQLVTIVGEPGIGKTRLLAELLALTDDLPELVRWRQGRCLPYGDGVTFWALGEILKAEAGILESDDPAAAAGKLDAAVSDTTPDATWLRQRLRPLVGLDAPSAERDENFGAWRAFIESLASDGPAVVVFEDLHWADGALLDFVRDLVDRASGPLLVVATTRPELYVSSPEWAAGLRNATTVTLTALSEGDTAKLIGELLGSVMLPGHVQQAVLERSGGNPLYAEEFVRLLKDRAILVEQGGTWRIDPNATMPTPVGLQTLIGSRIDALGRNEQALLEDAAVIGRVFWSGALARVAGRAVHEVEVALDELRQRELIRPLRDSTIAGEREYSFSHALVRDVAYGRIPKAGRVDKHVSVAAWLEGVAGDRDEDLSEILAAHYEAALTASAGSPAPALVERTIRYLVLAGERAFALDPAAAHRSLTRALEIMAPEDVERPDVLVRDGEALQSMARFEDALRSFDEAIGILERRGDMRKAALASLRSRLTLLALGDPRGRERVRRAVERLGADGPSPELVEALAYEAVEQVLGEGNADEGIDVAERALRMASELGVPTPARALGTRGCARLFKGDTGGIEDLRRAHELAIEQVQMRDAVTLMFNLANFTEDIEGANAALRMRRDGLADAERYGIVELILAYRSALAATLLTAGDWEEGVTMCDEVAHDLEEQGNVWDLAFLRIQQGPVLADRGEIGAARRISSWALDLGRSTGEAQMRTQAIAALAYVAARAGRDDEAAALIDELFGEDLRDSPQVVWILNIVSDIAVRLGRAGSLKAVLPDRPMHGLGARQLATARGCLAEAEQDLVAAAGYFRAAADAASDLGDQPLHAFSLLRLGRCLSAIGNREGALLVLEDAHAAFTSMGATSPIRDVEVVLGKLPDP